MKVLYYLSKGGRNKLFTIVHNKHVSKVLWSLCITIDCVIAPLSLKLIAGCSIIGSIVSNPTTSVFENQALQRAGCSGWHYYTNSLARYSNYEVLSHYSLGLAVIIGKQNRINSRVTADLTDDSASVGRGMA
jgi:hypothetical protein